MKEFTHGGSRKGAGRPKTDSGSRIQLTLHGRLRGPLEALKTATGAKSTAQAVAKIIEEHQKP